MRVDWNELKRQGKQAQAKIEKTQPNNRSSMGTNFTRSFVPSAEGYNAWTSGLSAFATGLGSAAEKRQGSFTGVSDFGQYKHVTDGTIGEYKKQASQYRDYFTTNADKYDAKSIEGVMRDLDSFEAYLDGVAADLESEQEYWSTFKDEDDYKTKTARSVEQVQADIDAKTADIDKKIAAAEARTRDYSVGDAYVMEAQMEAAELKKQRAEMVADLEEEMKWAKKARQGERNEQLGHKYDDDSGLSKGLKSIGKSLVAGFPLLKDIVGAEAENAKRSLKGENKDIIESEEYKALVKEYTQLYQEGRALSKEAVGSSERAKQKKARIKEIEKLMDENEKKRNEMLNLATVDPDSTGMKMLREANLLRQDVVEDIDSKDGQFLANTAMSIGQNAAVMAPALIASAIPGLQAAAPVLASAALPIMGVSSGAQKAYEVLEAGGSTRDALGRGILSGSIEAVTEKMGIDNLMDLIKTGGKSAVANMLKQAGAEATEETVSYVMNFAADKFNHDPNATWSWAELAESAASGGVSGLFFGGTGTAVNSVKNAANNAVIKRAENILAGREMTEAGKNFALVDSVVTAFPEGSKARQMAEQFYTAMENSRNANTEISEAQWSQLRRTVEAELDTNMGPATPQAREAVLQALHPDEKVMSPTASAFIAAGDNARVADAKSAVMDRVMDGDTTLTDSELRSLDLESPKTKEAFAKLTGVELPAVNDSQALLAAAREAVNNYAQIKAGQAALDESGDRLLAGMEQQAAARAAEMEAQVAQKAAEKAVAPKAPTPDEMAARVFKAPAPTQATAPAQQAQPAVDVGNVFRAPGQQASPTVKLSNGQTVTREAFVKGYMADNPTATMQDALQVFDEAVRGNQFGILYPMEDGKRYSAPKSKRNTSAKQKAQAKKKAETKLAETTAQAAEEATPAQSAEAPEQATITRAEQADTRAEGVDTTRASEAVQSPAEASAEVEDNALAKEPTRLQRLVIKAMNDAVRGTAIKGVRMEFWGDGDDAANGHFAPDTKEIVLNGDKLTTAKALNTILGHEMFHGAHGVNAKIVDEVFDAAEKCKLFGEDTEAHNKALAAMLEKTRLDYIDFLVKNGKTPEAAARIATLRYCQEELAADIMGDIYGNTDALYQLAKHNRTVFQKARDAVDNFILKLAGVRTEGANAIRTEAEWLANRMDRVLHGVDSDTQTEAKKESTPSVEGESAGNVRHALGAPDGYGITERKLRRITATPEFKAWFHDGNGELVDKKTGLPMVFYHGTGTAGYTRFENQEYGEPGFWFAKHRDTADSEYYTGREFGDEPTREFRPRAPKSWKKMLEYIESEYQHLMAEFDEYTGMYTVSDAESWEVLGAYKPTKSGLAKLDADLQDLAVTDEPGVRGKVNPGIYQVFLSMKNPLVVDCGGEAWDRISPSAVPAGLRGEIGLKDNGLTTTNLIVEAAQQAGYDGVILKNVRDGRMGEGEQTLPADMPAEVLEVLTKHDNFGAPNADAALDAFAELGFLPGLSGSEEAVLSDYVSDRLDNGEMDGYGTAVSDDDFVVFDSSQIKSAHNVGTFDPQNKDIRFSVTRAADSPSGYREYAPTFFSKMEQEIGAFKQAKMGATSVVPYLKGHGVKDEEIRWSGIQQFLEGKKSVTREELREFVKMNTMELEEQVLDGHREAHDLMDETTGEVYEDFEHMRFVVDSMAEAKGYDPEDVRYDYSQFPENGWIYAYVYKDGEEIDLTSVQAKTIQDKDPQWEDYKTPGGDGYRELLYKMPGSDYTNHAMGVHWGNADEGEGVLAHARVQDFKDPDGGDMLFIEEIQSDWHNVGQKVGYKSKDFPAKQQELKDLQAKNRSDGLNEEERRRMKELKAELYPKWTKLAERTAVLEDRLVSEPALVSAVEKIAEAKFDGNVDYAINNILSTRTSSMYIDDLSALGVKFAPDESTALRVLIGDNLDLQQEYREYMEYGGMRAEAENRAPEAPYAKNYHEYVLKRLLRKAAEEGYDSIGWTTGKMQEERWSSDYAEGYRIEYDQDIPKFLNKYGKQWGAKVEKTRLSNGGEVDTDLIDVYRDDLEYWRKELEDATDDDDRRDFCQSQIGYAQKQIDRLEDRGRGTEVWTMKLTDAMREDVLYKGQPRYSVGKVADNVPSWDKQVSIFLNGYYDQMFKGDEDQKSVLYVAKEPTALLQAMGLSDLPLVMTQGKARNILAQRWADDGTRLDEHAHQLSEEQLRKVPEYIQNPVMVIASDPKGEARGGVIIMTDDVDPMGNPIGVTIKADQPRFTYGGKTGPAHFVNVYGRENFDNLLAAAIDNGSVLYLDKERAQNTSFGTAIKLYERTRDLDSKAIIREKDPTVKPAERRFSTGKKVKTGGNTGNVNPDTGYERGSLADSFMRVLRTGDRQGALDMLEQAAQQLAQAEADRREHLKQETVSNTFRPKLTEDAIARNRRVIEELIAKYGEMEQTSAAQREVHLPKQIDDNTKVRSFVQTLEAAQATTEDVRNTLDADILAGTAGTTYTPITDSAAMREVKRALKNKTEFEKARREWSAIVESGQLPTKQDIAKAEALYVQACAEGQVFEAQKLAAEIAVMGTQAGQVVQAMSLVKRMTPAGQLYYIQKTVDRLNAEKAQKDRNVKLKIDPKLAQQLLAAKDKSEIDAALDAITQSLADQMPVTVYDKWNTWRYLAMLGNPRTHVRNLAGNAIFTPARLIKDVAAMGLEHMVIRDKGQRTKGFADKDLRDFARQDAELMEDELRGGGKYDTKEMIRDKRRIFKAAPLHAAEKLNSGLLEGEDWLFLRGAYTSALSGFLAARGFTAEQVSGANSTKEGRAALDAGRVYAINEAKKATYRDASKLAQWLNHTARNSGPVGSILLGGLVPFTKTPVNIVKRGLDYSVAGLAKSLVIDLNKVKRGDMSAAQAIDNIAAGMTGTAIMALGYFLARAGLLVGGLGDDDEDKFEELQGNQDYSIRAGDNSYTIDWMAPTVLPVFVGEAIHRLSEQEGLDGWEMLEASMGLLDPVMSLSMLDGLNNTLSAVKYDDGEPIPAILQTILGSYISQGVPSVMGAIARTADDTRRASFTPSGQTAVQRWADRLWQTSFLGKTPIASEGRMAYVDEWGRTDTESSVLMRAIENFVSPGYINPLKESPLEDELSRLAKATGDNGVYPNRAQKYFSVDKEKYVMTQEEYQEHLLYRGQKSYALASDITTSRTYDGLDDKTKAKAVELAYEYAASMAKVNTTEAYAPDKWMLKLAEFEENGGDAAEYLMLRAKSKTDDVSMTEMVLASPEMPINDAAEILFMERTMPKAFTDPYMKGYEYVMDDEQQREYAELYHDLYLPAYAELAVSPEYLEATPAERKERVSKLGTEINTEVKYQMSDRLFERGIESTEKQ